MQARLSRYFEKTSTHKYVDVLQQIVSAYNVTPHSSTKFRPVDVNESNQAEVWQNFYGKYLKQMQQAVKFKVGDTVRISRHKLLFEKVYTPNWSTEIFHLSRVQTAKPFTVYHLNDMNGEAIGCFYDFELMKA